MKLTSQQRFAALVERGIGFVEGWVSSELRWRPRGTALSFVWRLVHFSKQFFGVVHASSSGGRYRSLYYVVVFHHGGGYVVVFGRAWSVLDLRYTLACDWKS